jgi:hypothetical protein
VLVTEELVPRKPEESKILKKKKNEKQNFNSNLQQ